MSLMTLCRNFNIWIFLILISNKNFGQNKIDTSFNFNESKKSLTAIFILDTTRKATDSISFIKVLNFGKQNQPLILTYNENKNLFQNNGMDELKKYLGVDDSTNFIFNDNALITEIKQRKIFPIQIVKSETNNTNKENSSNYLLYIIPLAIGLALGYLASKLFNNKNNTMANEKMNKETLVKELNKISGKQQKNWSNEEIADEMRLAKNNENRVLEIIDKLNDEKGKLKNEIIELKKAVETLQKRMEKSEKFNSKILEKFVLPFNNKFNTVSSSYPLPDEDKKIFTETIFNIAFHYISYLADSENKAVENDKNNLKILFEGIKPQAKVMNINDPNNIRDFNALYLHIADELKRNGNAKLTEVNFRGVYFE